MYLCKFENISLKMCVVKGYYSLKFLNSDQIKDLRKSQDNSTTYQLMTVKAGI